MSVGANAGRGHDAPHSDALVVFGFTGDLATKQIFPALYRMVKTGALTVPVIGVASTSLSLEQMQQRVRDSIEQHGRSTTRRRSIGCFRCCATSAATTSNRRPSTR